MHKVAFDLIEVEQLVAVSGGKQITLANEGGGGGGGSDNPRTWPEWQPKEPQPPGTHWPPSLLPPDYGPQPTPEPKLKPGSGEAPGLNFMPLF